MERKKSIFDLPVVINFSDVFPEDLPGVPPMRQVEFRINMIPVEAPIAKALYHVASPEIDEFSSHL